MRNSSLVCLLYTSEIIKRTAFKITRMGQLVASEAAKELNAQFGIVDLSLAPTPEIGDSVAHILEEIGLSQVGGPGTTAALALLNDAVKKGGIMASSRVGGLSGCLLYTSPAGGKKRKYSGYQPDYNAGYVYYDYAGGYRRVRMQRAFRTAQCNRRKNGAGYTASA